MTEPQDRPDELGDRYDLRIKGDIQGQLVLGRNNEVVMGGPVGAVDLPRLTRFAEAIAQALPALDLDADQQRAVHQLTAAVLREAGENQPDHSRLREMGRSLRTVLEGAAAGALTSGILGMWSP
ncbi:hypothetical protein [Streptomyces incarnatus]|uniref:hypothetical protein n=1 Tax=Streptomyces incarnatus TaxID=665007 RepID=UPI000A41D960|nr:hypothetical protein [Streptomyces incarnatus]